MRLPSAAARRGLALAAVAVAAAIGVAALAGCASVPTTGPPERVHGGRFAATAEVDGKRDNTSGRFTLTVLADHLVLDLGTPLGTTLARIELTPAGATLRATDADGSVRQAQGRDGEALAEQLLGIPLPVAGIRDWIVGRAAPARPSVVSADGDAIEQDGWSIRIDERFAGGAPRRLTFTRTARVQPPAPAAAITLRLLLDDVAAGAASDATAQPVDRY